MFFDIGLLLKFVNRIVMVHYRGKGFATRVWVTETLLKSILEICLMNS